MVRGDTSFEVHEAKTQAPGNASVYTYRDRDLTGCIYRMEWLIAAEFECAFARTGAHLRTTPQARASPVRRPKPRAGCVSTDRGNARTRGISQPAQATRPQVVSRNRRATAQPPPWPSIAEPGVPEEASSGVLQSHIERLGSPPPLARIRARFLANPPEMSRKAVAQLVPFSGYRYSEDFETLKSGLLEPLFRGV